MSSRPPNSSNASNLGGPLAAVGVGLLMVVCCAGPVLLAAGGLSVLGAALHHPWLLVGAAVLVLAAVGITIRLVRARRDHGGGGTSAGEACCPPGWPGHRAANSSHDHLHLPGDRPHDVADPAEGTPHDSPRHHRHHRPPELASQPVPRRDRPRGGSTRYPARQRTARRLRRDRKSTRLNSSHVEISYAVFCLKKKKKKDEKYYKNKKKKIEI